jgi:hypothetical protein
MKLDSKDRHILSLVQKGADDEGWASVSEIVWPVVDSLSLELVEKEKNDVGGRVRLTETGKIVLAWS